MGPEIEPDLLPICLLIQGRVSQPLSPPNMSVYADTANSGAPFVPAQRSPAQDAALSPFALAPADAAALDANGFLILPELLTEAQVAAIERLVAECEAREGSSVGLDHQTEPGVTRVGNLLAKDTHGACPPLTNPTIIAAVAHGMAGRGLSLDSLTLRRVFPGRGLQPLHRDVDIPEIRAVNALVAISPFTEDPTQTRLCAVAWMACYSIRPRAIRST